MALHRCSTVTPTESSRSAPCCRSLRRRTTSTRRHRADPTRRSARARRDDVAARRDSAGVGRTSSRCTAPRKVWRQLRRERITRGALHGRTVDARARAAWGRARPAPGRRRSPRTWRIARSISSRGTSRRRDRISSGSRTSPTSRPGAASSTSPSSSTSSRAASSAGACRARCGLTSRSTRSSRRSVSGSRRRRRALVHHSDRGVQYLSIRYTERLVDAGIEPSVGSRGDSYDNALAESVIGLFKTEVIPSAGTVAGSRRRRIRDARMGRVVQPPTAARTTRLCTAGGV